MLKTIEQSNELKAIAIKASFDFRQEQRKLCAAMAAKAKEEVISSITARCNELSAKAEKAWRNYYGERPYSEPAITSHVDPTFNDYINSPKRLATA